MKASLDTPSSLIKPFISIVPRLSDDCLLTSPKLIPGEPLREGVDLIADKKTGALIVVGSSAKLDKISSGGINLSNCKFTPEMLCELAKMDGAVIVDENVDKILKANVHLNQ